MAQSWGNDTQTDTHSHLCLPHSPLHCGFSFTPPLLIVRSLNSFSTLLSNCLYISFPTFTISLKAKFLYPIQFFSIYPPLCVWPISPAPAWDGHMTVQSGSWPKLCCRDRRLRSLDWSMLNMAGDGRLRLGNVKIPGAGGVKHNDQRKGIIE